MRGVLEELSHFDLAKPDLPPGVQADWAASDGTRRWANGRRSTLTMPCPQVDADIVLVLTVDPFRCIAQPQQILRVCVDETTIRLAQFGERAVVVCVVTRALTAGRERLVITFEHPDGIRPDMVSDSGDSRTLSVGFVEVAVATWRETEAEPAPQPPPDGGRDLPPAPEIGDEQLMSHFASLGDNCEFGTVQRYAKAEPMDLLRFVGLSAGNLLSGLSCGFGDVDRLGDLEFLVLQSGGKREYMLHQRRYAMHSHTGVVEGQMSRVRLLGRERRKLGVLARLFREDLAGARRIFVFKRNEDRNSEAVMPILRQLRAWGPNTLLHVVQADGDHKPGHVEVLPDGLLRGYIDRFNPYNDGAAPPSPVWLELCRRSYAIWREHGRPD